MQETKYAMGGEVKSLPARLFGEQFSPVKVEVPIHLTVVHRADVDALTTRVLEVNLGHLEDLRATLERTNRKTIRDVREVAGWGADLLVGIETTISYQNLVALINEFRDGIAARRMAAKVPA